MQDWLPVEDVLDVGVVKLKNGKYIKILKVIPINYNLKSDLEKCSILNSYKIFLKTCDFDMQILIQSSKENLDSHNFNVLNNIQKEKNKYLEKIGKDYINYINDFNSNRKSSTKNFYIIVSNKNVSLENKDSLEIVKSELKEKYFKIKECLSRCGNSVIEINDNKDISKVLFSFFNTRKTLIKK